MLILDDPDWTKCAFLCVLTTEPTPLIVYLWINSQSAHSESQSNVPFQTQNSLPDYLTQRQPSVKTLFDHRFTDPCLWMLSLCPTLYSLESIQVINTVIFLQSRHQYTVLLCFQYWQAVCWMSMCFFVLLKDSASLCCRVRRC